MLRMAVWGARSIAGLTAAVALVIDQASKWMILEHVMEPSQIIVVAPFFNLTLWFNRGVTFGFLSSDGDLGRWLLIALTLTIVVVLALWARRSTMRLEGAALGAIIGGALGNIIDRLRHGGVVDFLDFHAFGWHWPAFNMADVTVVCGVAALMLNPLLPARETAKG